MCTCYVFSSVLLYDRSWPTLRPVCPLDGTYYVHLYRVVNGFHPLLALEPTITAFSEKFLPSVVRERGWSSSAKLQKQTHSFALALACSAPASITGRNTARASYQA